ncbi:hypothetical protein Enr13x_24170 [Stieleria neptunia]|uniref:Glycosyltransferase RgtA/B/C/D-like domain-containing protein n=2 Tax=Stieleria neptunia TaxID=2527979 RepID=A0A518HP02_9BACT|nr:hypothetical protein Enr13x_24170 [Stieleria neptunia]
MRALLSKPMAACVITLLLSIHTALLVYSAKVHSPTWDEVGHLAAGLSHWELRKFELYSVNPPLVRTIAAAPVYLFCTPKMDWSYYRSDPTLRSEVYLGRRMIALNGIDSLRFFYIARLALIPLSLVGALFCFLWAKTLFGLDAGVAAVLLWSFSPNVLAYGSLITPDLGSSVAFLGACFTFWQWLERPAGALTLLLSLAMAIAMVTKSVWLGLPVLFGGILLLKIAKDYFSAGKSRHSAFRTLVLFGVAVAGSLVGVNACYGFRGSCRPLGSYQFLSQRLSGVELIRLPLNDCPECAPMVRTSMEPANRFASRWTGAIPIPLPENYTKGIDIQIRDFERGHYDGRWQSYLLGSWQQGGWWHYYLLGLVWKLPIPTLLAIIIAVVSSLLAKETASVRWGYVCLLVPATAFFIAVSASTGLNRYFRYCLPVLPTLLVFASQTAVRWHASTKRLAHGCLFSLFIACCIWLPVVSVRSNPHHLSYFNELGGGPSTGYQLLSDTSVDSGQDLLLLVKWLAERSPGEKPIYLAYFGSFSPSDIGIGFKLPPPRPSRRASGHPAYRREQLSPGWYVISKNYVAGHSMPVPSATATLHFHYFGPNAFSYFRHFPVVEEIGHSMNVYHITRADSERFAELVALNHISADR